MRHARTFIAAILCTASSALAWSAHGHRTITYLALEAMPAESPEWLRDASTRHRIADQSNEPDRWRGLQADTLGHENGPDHYIDLEDLAQFGLTLETVSPFRYEFLRDMAVALHEHPENAAPYDAAADRDKTRRWPGFLPHAIQEHYNKLRSSFNTLRILEALKDPAREDQVKMARENCVQHMGLLSHFVADAAQPLHTTTHHHGWVGENPNGYTRERGIHSYIDGTIVDLHAITVESLRPLARPGVTVNAADPWKDVLAYIRRSNDRVEPLYALEKAGELSKEKGKALIEERFTDAGAMLGALYAAAWTSSEATEREIQAWVRFNNFKPELLPYQEGRVDAPAASPAPEPASPFRSPAK
jgi:hypothetical protein